MKNVDAMNAYIDMHSKFDSPGRKVRATKRMVSRALKLDDDGGNGIGAIPVTFTMTPVTHVIGVPSRR